MGRQLIAIAALSVVFSACSSNSLEGYFESVAAVTSAYQAEIADLPTAATDSTLDDIRIHFTGVDAAITQALEDLNELEPPDGVQYLHPPFVESVSQFAAVARTMADRAGGLVTQTDLNDLAMDPVVGVINYNILEAGMGTTCQQLQFAANRNDVPIDLGCGLLSGE